MRRALYYLVVAGILTIIPIIGLGQISQPALNTQATPVSSRSAGPEPYEDDGLYWDDQFGLPSGDDHAVFAAASNGREIYAGGDFTSINGVAANCIAKWDGTTWTALGGGLAGPDEYSVPRVRAIAISGNNVYVGGEFTTAGDTSASNIAKWDGTRWSSLGTGVEQIVFCILADNDTVYVGGHHGVAEWDSGVWGYLNGPGAILESVNCLLLKDGELLAGGADNDINGGIQKWNGTSWTAVGVWENGWMPGAVRSLAVIGDELYAGGGTFIAQAYAFGFVAKIHGTGFTKIASMATSAHSLVPDGTGFYVAGVFCRPDTMENCSSEVRRYDGSAWSTIGSSPARFGGRADVYSLLLHGPQTLVLGGRFDNIAGRPAQSFGVLQPRVNLSQAVLTSHPGETTIGNDIFGFYKPCLTTNNTTVVAYDGELPTTVTIDRAEEILVNGKRVNGAFTLTPEGMEFGGDEPTTLRIEFSEDDAALFGSTYTDFRAVRLTYPPDYPANKEAATVTKISNSVPQPIRTENGRQIYAITIPFAGIASTYGAVPVPPSHYALTLQAQPPAAGFIAADPLPGDDGKYLEGTVVTLTAIAADGYNFATWSGAATDNTNPTVITMAENVSLTANFQPVEQTFALSVNSQPAAGGSVTVDPSSANGRYVAGTVVTLTPQPEAVYIFSHWSGDLEGTTSPVQITIDRDMNVTAEFAPADAANLCANLKRIASRSNKNGTLVTGQFTVENRGSEKSTPASVSIYLTAPGSTGSQGTLLQTKRVPYLKPGMAKKLQLVEKLPAGTDTSGMTITVVVDPNNAVNETNETDNRVSSDPLP